MRATRALRPTREWTAFTAMVGNGQTKVSVVRGNDLHIVGARRASGDRLNRGQQEDTEETRLYRCRPHNRQA